MDMFSCHRISSGSLLSWFNSSRMTAISEKIGFIVYSITLLLLLTVTVTQKGVRFFLFSLEQMILFYQHPDQLCTWYKLDICVLNNTYMVEVI